MIIYGIMMGIIWYNDDDLIDYIMVIFMVIDGYIMTCNDG